LFQYGQASAPAAKRYVKPKGKGMNANNAVEKNIEIAIQYQEKFEFYIVGLTFTILGLSVQTAKFTGSSFAQAAELLSWICLFITGIGGLSRIQNTPQLYKLFSLKSDYEIRGAKTRELRAQGLSEVMVLEDMTNISTDQYISQADSSIEVLNAQIKKIQENEKRKYKIIRTTLLLGFGLLIIARGIDQATNLIAAITG
jgi:hypothetical protein